MLAAFDGRQPVRVLGGLAIWMTCRSARGGPLRRDYADADFVALKRDRVAIGQRMVELGYFPDKRFNSLHGDQRLYFHDRVNERHVDFFVDALRMCHTIDLRRRIVLVPDVLPASDLLLTKLQVVELNRKDTIDLLALLHDRRLAAGENSEFDSDYLGWLWGADWGLWNTCGLTLRKCAASARELAGQDLEVSILEKVRSLEGLLETCPKTIGWRARARIGERMRWYESPDEVVR